MAKTIATGRKPGTGLSYPVKANPIRGCYKIYFLTSLQDPFVRFVSYTTDYPYNALQRFIYLAKRNNSSKLDKWILERLASNDKLKLVQQNFYPSGTTEKQVLDQVNIYIEENKATILNKQKHTFIGKYKSRGLIISDEKVEKIKMLSTDEYLTSRRIAELVGTTKQRVDYYRLKLGVSKKFIMEKRIKQIKKHNFKGLTGNQLRYIEMKYISPYLKHKIKGK